MDLSPLEFESVLRLEDLSAPARLPAPWRTSASPLVREWALLPLPELPREPLLLRRGSLPRGGN